VIIYVKLTNIGKILTVCKYNRQFRGKHRVCAPVETTRWQTYLKVSLCYSPIPLETEVHIDWKSIYDIKHECVRQVGFLSSAGVRLLRGLDPSTRGPG
jgi:hypothetical protein